jgi:MscS family membrane protein
LGALAVGRIARFVISRIAGRIKARRGADPVSLFLASFAGPVALLVFSAGVYLSRLTLVIQPDGVVDKGFARVSHVLAVLAVAYLFYRLVDVVDFYLRRWSSRTETTLDDMLVPIVRKVLRVIIWVGAVLFIAQNILDQPVGTVLAAAGVGGIALALAAQQTLSNFFGSVTIFADRPFQVGDVIKVGPHTGPVEDVGFRSTRIRTVDGHLVTVPNSTIANEMVENIGLRPSIKRVANIGITYDTPREKVERAVQILKDILAPIKEINGDEALRPRVYFTDFKDFSLNIQMIYWVKPPDYWLAQEIGERVNLEIMRAFAAEGIEFAFPTQTLYLKRVQG